MFQDSINLDTYIVQDGCADSPALCLHSFVEINEMEGCRNSPYYHTGSFDATPLDFTTYGSTPTVMAIRPSDESGPDIELQNPITGEASEYGTDTIKQKRSAIKPR